MKKALLAGVAALVATMAMGASSALAAPAPTTAVCLGGSEEAGSFVPNQTSTGLGLFNYDTCVLLNGGGILDSLAGLGEDLGEAEPPSEAPTPEQIQAIVDDLAELDPSNALGLLGFVVNTCSNLNSTSVCNAIISGALNNTPIPFGRVTLDRETGFCFGGSQTGSGQLSGLFSGSDNYSLDWDADYETAFGLLGVLSGTATNTQFGSPAHGEEVPLTGVIGPSCSPGAKVLILQVG